jgi:hypothetical protein
MMPCTRIGLTLVGFLAVVTVYLAILRPRQLRWGATTTEVARALPGATISDAGQLGFCIRHSAAWIWSKHEYQNLLDNHHHR